MASCTLEAKDGMVITTKSQKLDQLRRLALELLLAGHPEDCSTCPKYGNCELQMLIQYIGPKTGRLKMRTKGFSENEKNPLIIHDISQCFRKWNFFPDYCCGSIRISTSDISYVPRNIRMGRACMTAWHNSILFCFICINKLIAYCTCWTYFNACLTKTAIGIF